MSGPVSGKERVPGPTTTTGKVNSVISSTSWLSSSTEQGDAALHLQCVRLGFQLADGGPPTSLERTVVFVTAGL